MTLHNLVDSMQRRMAAVAVVIDIAQYIEIVVQPDLM